MITTTATWDRVFGSGVKFHRSYLVEIVGVGKWMCSWRPMFGYLNSIAKVNRRPSTLNLVDGSQTVAALSLEFLNDGSIADQIVAGHLVGKKVIVKIGACKPTDAEFTEADFADWTTGIIVKHRKKAGGFITLECHDMRSVMWDRAGMSQVLPNASNADIGHLINFSTEGCAPLALAGLFTAAGFPAGELDLSTFQAANCPKTGHLVVDRRKVPSWQNYTHLPAGEQPDDLADTYAESDRRIKEAVPVRQLADNVLKVLRSFLLVQEDGLLRYKESDVAEAAVLRFTADDIRPGSVECGLSDAHIVTSAEITSFFEGDEDHGGPTHKFRFRSDDSAAQVEWQFEDTTPRQSDWQLTDDFFCSRIIRQADAPNVSAAATVITGIVKENDNFTGEGSGTPNAVDATHPMYIYMWGMVGAGGVGSPDYPNTNGEIIKVTKVIENGDYSFTFGDGGSPCVRGEFGTTARQHGRAGIGGAGDLVSTTSDVFMIDITAIVRAVEQVIGGFKKGADVLSFVTPLNLTYKLQLGEVAYAETPDFLSEGLNGLAVGNTIAWRCIEKDPDGDLMECKWTFQRLYPVETHTPNVGGHVWGWGGGRGDHPESGGDRFGSAFAGTFTGGSSYGQTAGELSNAFLRGVHAVAPTSGLQVRIPEQIAGTRVGVVKVPETAWTMAINKDTYFDLRPLPGGRSSWQRLPVANGAAAPAITAGDMRAFKVVSNGVAVTSVVDLRGTAIVDTPNVKDDAINDNKLKPGITGSKFTGGAGSLTHLSAAGVFDSLVNIATRTVDLLVDGTYARTLAAALLNGKINLAAGAAGLAGTLAKSFVSSAGTWSAAEVPVAGAITGQGALATLNQVNTAQIVAGAADNTILAAGSVTAANGAIAANAVVAASLAAGQVADSHIDAAAAIAGSKMSSAFALPGSLSVATTATIAGATTLQGALTAQGATKFEQPVAVLKANSDGQPYAFIIDRDTTNYIKNPSFEVDTAGWSADIGGGGAGSRTIARDATKGFFGSCSLQCTTTSAAGGAGNSPGFNCDSEVAIVSGDKVSAQCWVFHNEGVDVNVDFAIEQLDASHVYLGTQVSAKGWVVPSGTWTRIWAAGTASGGTTAFARARIRPATPGSGSDVIWVDGVQTEKSIEPSSYCDGSLGPGYAWSGTAHNSASTRSGGQRSLGSLAPDKSSIVVWDDSVIEAPRIRNPFRGYVGIGAADHLDLQVAGAGTKFPGSSVPVNTNDVFFRTDRGILYYYDGTRWLSVEELALSVPAYNQLPSTAISANSDNAGGLIVTPSSHSGQVYLTNWALAVFIGATNSGANYWNLTIKDQPLTTTIATQATSGLAASSGWNRVVKAVNSVRTVATDKHWNFGATKVGAPSNINFAAGVLHYRLVG